MAIKQVTATRMTMLGLKNQKNTAERGHKLLKDKRDGLMQEFMKIVHKAKALREEVEASLSNANEYFLEAQTIMPKAMVRNTFSDPYQSVTLSVKTKNVMSVRIPQFTLKSEGDALGYGMAQTAGTLDIAISSFSLVFLKLLELAEIEKSAENLAIEIEKTRRRVNALEYTLIPDLNDTLKFVKMKLGEEERSGIVQTMAVKNMIEKQEAEKHAKRKKAQKAQKSK